MKGAYSMARTLSEEYSLKLAKLLIDMGIQKEIRLEVLSAIETPEAMLLFLDKLSEKNYEMTSEEVYEALAETVEEMS
jgi:hypothetical protein